MSSLPFHLWSPEHEFPTVQAMPDLDIVTHVAVERATPGGFHYLHEPTIARHGDHFIIGWANHRLLERNSQEEVLRGVRSHDGLQWSTPTTWLQPPDHNSESWNHPIIFVRDEQLWGFFTRWNEKQPATEVFRSDDGQNWQTTGARIPGFIPFRVPQKLPNGNWIIGGELGWETAAVAISNGDDFSDWHTVAIANPPEIKLRYPEVTLLTRGEELVAILRPCGDVTAPVAVSRDHGENWAPMQLSNFPMASSQPYCGRLSTGQQFLLCNPFVEEGRTLLAIAVTRPGECTFERIWKVRHQQWPAIRLLGHQNGPQQGKPTQWSYPGALEHDGKLYVVYTHGKEDCALSIIPISALQI